MAVLAVGVEKEMPLLPATIDLRVCERESRGEGGSHGWPVGVKEGGND